MGRMDYLSGITWKNRNSFGRLLQHRTRTYDNCSCVVVGQVTPLRAFLEPHGDFDDSNLPGSFKNAKLKFSLVRPDIGIPSFGEEYNMAISNLRRITHGLPDSIVDDTFLSLQNDGSTVINFSWDLFEDVRLRYLTTIMPNISYLM